MKKINTSTLKRILSYIKGYRGMLMGSFACALITTACTLLVPKLIGDAIDGITGKGTVQFDYILECLVKCGILILISAITNRFMGLFNTKIVYGVTHDIRRDAIRKLEKISVANYDRMRSGDIINRVISDVDTCADGLLLGFTNLFTGFLTILITLVMMLLISPSITLMVVVLTPVSLLIAAIIAKNTHKGFKRRSETGAKQAAYIDEMIGNSKLVKAYNFEDEAKEHYEQLNKEYMSCSMKAIFFSSLVNPSTRFVNNIIYAMVALVGGYGVVGKKLTIGGLSIVLNYSAQYAKPFNEISGVVTELGGAFACAERVFEIIDKEDEADASGGAKNTQAQGAIEFKDVSFSYTPERPLIEHLNLNVKPGQMIALVGPTGCGKTTFINLLMRFYDITAGQIFVDGVDVATISRGNLRENFGMVLQDTFLCSGSIKENIAMGKPKASMEEIREAAKKAHADGFISRLPEGYETVVGEGGMPLSEGQRQLIAIARIMLKLPPILILDEATSSIDTRTELKIQAAFEELMRGRTSFIVAHRLSTIRHADTILVMRDGHIIESGNHEELMLKNGFYAELNRMGI